MTEGVNKLWHICKRYLCPINTQGGNLSDIPVPLKKEKTGVKLRNSGQFTNFIGSSLNYAISIHSTYGPYQSCKTGPSTNSFFHRIFSTVQLSLNLFKYSTKYDFYTEQWSFQRIYILKKDFLNICTFSFFLIWRNTKFTTNGEVFIDKFNFKDIVQWDLTGVEIRLKRSVLMNYIVAMFGFWILKEHFHERCTKLVSAS